MSIKQVQIAFDEKELKRKKNTGKTWREIIELGIDAAEKENDK